MASAGTHECAEDDKQAAREVCVWEEVGGSVKIAKKLLDVFASGVVDKSRECRWEAFIIFSNVTKSSVAYYDNLEM